MPEDNLILYACGSGLIVDYIELCGRNQVTIKYVVNNRPDGPGTGFAWISAFNHDFANETTPFLVPLFGPRNRYIATQEALGHHLAPFGLLSDRNNDLPMQFVHGVGCFINKRVVIGAAASIGNHVLINRGACLGHHVQLQDYVSIGPGVVTGGDVVVRTGACIGTGAVILPQVTVGKHAVVSAGAVVGEDVNDYSVVIGNPARPIRQNDDAFSL